MSSTATLINEEKRMPPLTSCKSFESIYSSNSSKLSSLTMYRRKLNKHQDNYEVRQRVISARLHRMKSLQNQLGDAQIHIAELTNENRLLRSLHKRQDSALARYENSTAELPHLLRSHAEEVRVAEERCRNLQQKNKELTARLKQKDNSILALTDQNKHLNQLNQNKNLEEREKLTNRVRYLEIRLNEKDEEVKVLHRRLLLESKTFKTQLNGEILKNKELCHKLEKLSLDRQNVEIPQFNKFGNLNKTIPNKFAKLSPKSRNPKELLNNIGDSSTNQSLFSNTSDIMLPNKYAKVIQQPEPIKQQHKLLIPEELKQRNSYNKTTFNSDANETPKEKLPDSLPMPSNPTFISMNRTSIDFKDIKYNKNEIVDVNDDNDDNDDEDDDNYSEDYGTDETAYSDERVSSNLAKVSIKDNVIAENNTNENNDQPVPIRNENNDINSSENDLQQPAKKADIKDESSTSSSPTTSEKDEILKILHVKKKKNETLMNRRYPINIDSQKKSKLLATLRAIDAKEI